MSYNYIFIQDGQRYNHGIKRTQLALALLDLKISATI